MIERIDEICAQQVGKEKAGTLDQINDKIVVLNEIDQSAPIKVGKISSTLQSYDLHQNDQYERLEQLKEVLDTCKINHEK